MFQLLTDRGIGIVQPKGSDWVAVRAPRHHNGAVVALQRGPYGDATAMPLQTNGGLTARKSRFFGVKTATKNSPTFSLWKSREGLTGTMGRRKCAFRDVKSCREMTNGGLTRWRAARERRFRRRRFCSFFYNKVWRPHRQQSYFPHTHFYITHSRVATRRDRLRANRFNLFSWGYIHGCLCIYHEAVATGRDPTLG